MYAVGLDYENSHQISLAILRGDTMRNTYERHLKMLEYILKIAGLIITTISTVVKIIDLIQQWKDKKTSKKQPPEPR